jgi:hypothetical protein
MVDDGVNFCLFLARIIWFSRRAQKYGFVKRKFELLDTRNLSGNAIFWFCAWSSGDVTGPSDFIQSLNADDGVKNLTAASRCL